MLIYSVNLAKTADPRAVTQPPANIASSTGYNVGPAARFRNKPDKVVTTRRGRCPVFHDSGNPLPVDVKRQMSPKEEEFFRKAFGKK